MNLSMSENSFITLRRKIKPLIYDYENWIEPIKDPVKFVVSKIYFHHRADCLHIQAIQFLVRQQFNLLAPEFYI